MMRIPAFSSYLRNVALEDSCKLMSRLLQGKVPLTETIDIIIDSAAEPSTYLYWKESKDRIMAGVEPARALRRWPLLKSETDQIATIQSVDQLAEVYKGIAEERGLMGKADQRKLWQWGIFFMMFFAGAVVLTLIYLLMIQNQGTLDSLNELRK
jgi:type II secretory pathway component PulF